MAKKVISVAKVIIENARDKNTGELVDAVFEAGGGSATPGTDSIGSKEIRNDSVDFEDLTPEVRDAIKAGGTPATDSDIDELFPQGGGSEGGGGKEYADNSDIDELFGGGGQKTPVQEGDGEADDDI